MHLQLVAERQRQIKAKGYAPDHDDEHANGELAAASACYARHVKSRSWVFLQTASMRTETSPCRTHGP